MSYVVILCDTNMQVDPLQCVHTFAGSGFGTVGSCESHFCVERQTPRGAF